MYTVENRHTLYNVKQLNACQIWTRSVNVKIAESLVAPIPSMFAETPWSAAVGHAEFVQFLSIILQCTSFADAVESSKANCNLTWSWIINRILWQICSVLHNRVGAVHICSQRFTFWGSKHNPGHSWQKISWQVCWQTQFLQLQSYGIMQKLGCMRPTMGACWRVPLASTCMRSQILTIHSCAWASGRLLRCVPKAATCLQFQHSSLMPHLTAHGGQCSCCSVHSMPC